MYKRQIQNRIVENGKRGKATWLYIDEFHVLLNSEYSAKYLQPVSYTHLFNEFMARFNEVCAVPFATYYNSNTVKAVAIALGIYAMAIVMYYTSQRNYMPGKEFGTARFENPKQVNKILADKDENFNRILSQNVKMSLDFRRLKLNGNILICGGSGAGKTFYEVKPNLCLLYTSRCV